MKRCLFSIVGVLALLITMISGSLTSVGAQDTRTVEFAKAKCEWLRANFPQSTSELQALGASLAGVPIDRVTTNPYYCNQGGTEAVFDGFVILGKNEGKGSDLVTLTVPEHGAIDGSQPSCGYTYTGDYTTVADLGQKGDDCEDTVRATSGTVTGNRLTYYPYYDLDHPGPNDKFDPGVEAKDVPQSTATNDSTTDTTDAGESACMTGADMADKMGWTLNGPQAEGVTMYGGATIQVPTDSTKLDLPKGWKADWNGPSVDGPGTLVAGEYYTIWPPEGDCRETLGVDQ